MAISDYLRLDFLSANYDLIGGSAAVIVLVIILWWILFRRQSGRLGEERTEERETQRLEADEKQAKNAQKDERKTCARMEKIVSEIQNILKKEGMGEIWDNVLSG